MFLKAARGDAKKGGPVRVALERLCGLYADSGNVKDGILVNPLLRHLFGYCLLFLFTAVLTTLLITFPTGIFPIGVFLVFIQHGRYVLFESFAVQLPGPGQVENIVKTGRVPWLFCKVIQISEKIAPSFQICFQRIPDFPKAGQFQKEELKVPGEAVVGMGGFTQRVVKEELVCSDTGRMGPLVVCHTEDIDGLEHVRFGASLYLTVNQGRTVKEQAVVHVRVRKALHLRDEALAAVTLFTNHIKCGTLLLGTNHGNLIGKVLNIGHLHGEDIVEQFEENGLVPQNVLEGIVYPEVHELGEFLRMVQIVLNLGGQFRLIGLKLFFNDGVQGEVLFHRQ